jgi:hypothetical protein
MMASAQSAVLPSRLPVRRVVAITQLDSVIKTGNTGVPEEKQARLHADQQGQTRPG